MNHRALLSLSISMLCGSNLCLADTTSTSSTNAKTNNIEEIEVRAYRTPTALGDVAASVISISADDIAAVQASDIEELFSYYPGVDVETDSRYGISSINIRGLSGNYVKIKVDNVDQPAAFSNSSLISSTRVDMEVDFLKSVEVVKGPASSTQGSEALGGTVLFTTVDPADVMSGSNKNYGGWVKADSISVDDGSKVSGLLANRFNRLETLIGFSQRRGNERETFADVEDEEFKKDYLLAKVVYAATENQQLSFMLEQSESSGFEPLDPGSYDEYNFADDSNEKTHVGFSHRWQANLAVFDNSAFQVDWLSKEQISQTFRKATTAVAQLKDYSFEEDGYTVDVQFDKHLDGNAVRQRWVYGLTYKDADYSNTNITRYDDNTDGNFGDRSLQYFYMPRANSSSIGIFIQDELIFADGRLHITPGLRYDRFEVSPYELELDLADGVTGFSSTNIGSYSDYKDSEVTGRIGVIWELTDSTKIFGQYGQGFKSPDFNQLFYSFANDMFGYKYQPNPELTSEYSDSYEFGLRGQAKELFWEVAAFRTNYDDFIDTKSDFTDPNYPAGIYRHVNVAESKVEGFELSGSMPISNSGFFTRLALSYSEGETGNGEPLESVNPWSSNLQISYDAPNQPWGANVNLNYVAAVKESDVADSSTQYLPDSYTTVDVNAYWQPTSSITMRAGIFNLGDEQYERWSNVRGLTPTDFDDSYSQPGRHWTLTAKYQF